MLELLNIKLSAGTKYLFHSDKIQLKSGVVALIGRNGSGKSSLLNILMGANSRFEGEILLAGKSLRNLDQAERAKLISVVYPKTELFGNHSVLDILLLGRIPYQNAFSNISQRDIELANETATRLGIDPFLYKEFQKLSDGEKQLVMIGRALIQDTPVILMDEPTAFLDLVNRVEVSALLCALAKEKNKLILYSTHNLERIETDCNGILTIHENLLKFCDAPGEFRHRIQEIFQSV